MSHQLFLTTRQKNEKKINFANNMSTDIKFSKAEISKIVQAC